PNSRRLENNGNFAINPVNIGDGIGHRASSAFFLRLFASPNGSNKLTQPRNRTHHFSNAFIADLFTSISDGFAGYALHLPYHQSHRHHLGASAHNPPHQEPAATSSGVRC